jgi:hypothetical protein
VRKPHPELERYLAGEGSDTDDTLPLVIALIVVCVIGVAAVRYIL